MIRQCAGGCGNIKREEGDTWRGGDGRRRLVKEDVITKLLQLQEKVNYGDAIERQNGTRQ